MPGLRHGFLDRGECGGDVWEAVVARAGIPVPVTVPRQVHGTRVVGVPADGQRPEADGLVTAAPGRLVGIQTADCAPVLLVAPSRRVAAAVHAGWRGAAAGILEAAVAHLADAGAEPATLEAVIGPAVGGCCYVVGEEVLDAFRSRTGQVTAEAWGRRGDRWHLDLRLAASLLLAAAGVRPVAVLGPCTACNRAYSSYRRDGAAAGRQLSFAGWV